MQALQKIAPAFGVALREVPEPRAPSAHEVLIAVAATGLCGTDVHIYEWTPGYERVASALPVTLGHEFAGHVVDAGSDVRDLVRGCCVAVRPSVVCGRCEACLRGDDEECVRRTGLGITRDGGLAKLVLVPAENCVPVPAGLEPEIAALTEPMTVCAAAVTTGGVKAGDRVLVLGPGTIGQGMALFARDAGAEQVVVVGRDDAARLDALRGIGFPDVVDSRDRELEDALQPWLACGRFDVVLEATGASATIGPALDVLKTHGTLVVAGIHSAPASIDLTRLVRARQQIRGAYRAPVATWPRVVDFLAHHRDLVRPMISHRVPLSNAIEGFELTRSRAASKVLILP